MTGRSTLPPVFCWTKMGTEAGQPLEVILRRKELERGAGGGTFAWGIGNSLGNAAQKARRESAEGELEVLFTAMRSRPRQIDRSPGQLLLWTSYLDKTGREIPLPRHMLVTSRGGSAKRSHYALLCRSDEHISGEEEGVAIDADCARNLLTGNPVGPSQVTSVVLYQRGRSQAQEKLYKVAFRAKLSGEGFVRLSARVPLDGALLDLYEEACRASTIDEWRARVATVRDAAQQQFAWSTHLSSPASRITDAATASTSEALSIIYSGVLPLKPY